MQLEPSIFGDILRALGAVPEPQQELRRRKSQRYHVDREATIKPFGVSNPVARPVTLVNISANGICIVDRATISSGEQFIVMLPLSGGGALNVLCTVRQSRLTATGAIRVGAEFTSEADHHRRFVRRVDRLGAAPGAPVLKEGEMRQPAMMRLPSGLSAARSVKVEVTAVEKGIFQITSPRAASIGEQIVLAFQFAERVQAWRCTVLEVRAITGSLFRIEARNDGPVPTQAPPAAGGSVWKWLKHALAGR